MYKIGFIGTGNMGGALAQAACRTIGADNVAVTDYDPKKAAQFAQENGCTALPTNNELAEKAEYIVLAVKPNVIKEVAAGIKEILAKDKKHIVVTIAAGVETKTVRSAIDDAVPVLRIMPNTPAAVGCGMILITAADYSHSPESQNTPEADSLQTTADKALMEFKEIMSGAGDYLQTPEKNFDIMTAVSSCSPAYIYMFIEALADGAVYVGVPREQALMLAAKTVLGSAQMVIETGIHPEKLKDNVCSPGGSTIAGVLALEENNFRFGVEQAIIKATEKNLNLGK